MYYFHVRKSFQRSPSHDHRSKISSFLRCSGIHTTIAHRTILVIVVVIPRWYWPRFAIVKHHRSYYCSVYQDLHFRWKSLLEITPVRFLQFDHAFATVTYLLAPPFLDIADPCYLKDCIVGKLTVSSSMYFFVMLSVSALFLPCWLEAHSFLHTLHRSSVTFIISPPGLQNTKSSVNSIFQGVPSPISSASTYDDHGQQWTKCWALVESHFNLAGSGLFRIGYDACLATSIIHVPDVVCVGLWNTFPSEGGTD